MSLTVEQLNADSTFIMTFAPPIAPRTHKGKFPGSFTILVDPWLDGESSILHPKFANTQHTVKSAVQSLAHMTGIIDLIVISQGMTDHCHRATLCSLPRDTNIKIAATPKAAAMIHSWKYFRKSIVHEIKPYSKDKGETVLRINIEPYSSSSAAGEITIAQVTQKRDISGVHNAIGMTYCPPGTVLTAADGRTINVADMTMMPLNSKAGKTPVVQKASLLSEPEARNDTPMRRSPAENERSSASHSNSTRRANDEKVLSVLYTPHGTSLSSLEPYIEHHLTPLRALPITALFHSMNSETNPWFLGGRICDGAPGAVSVAKAYGAKYWIGAHDEEKDVSGIGTRLVQSRRCGLEEATEMLRDISIGGGNLETEVVVLGSGGRRRFEG